MRKYVIFAVVESKRVDVVSFDSPSKAQAALEMFYCLTAVCPSIDVDLALRIEEVK